MTDAPDLAPPPLQMWWDTAGSQADRGARSDASHRDPPSRWAVPAVVLGAVGTDLALWTTGPGLAWTLGATAAAIAVLVGARPRRPAALVLLATVPLLAVWCTLRTSPWLLAPDIVAINLCLILGADLTGRGRWFDQSFTRVICRIVLVAEDAIGAVPWILPALRRSTDPDRVRRNWRPTIAGLVIVAPLVVVLAALLASADAVFASFLDVDLGVDGSVLIRHVLFLVGGAGAIVALLRMASATTDVDMGEPVRLSATIGNIVLGGVAGVFSLFALSRVLTLTGTAERIATTRGLTWAEYARSGFFQLLTVAAITLVVLVTVCGWCDRGSAPQTRVRRILGLVIVVEILGIVVDAVHRLSGYEHAYGLTMLRLYSTAFAAWIAVVFVLVGVAVATDYRGARWLTPTILTTALAAILVMNVVNPERIVADRILTSTTEYGEADVLYLADHLGDDAFPAIAAHIGDLDDDQRLALLDSVCVERRRSPQWFNPNPARTDGDRIFERWCGPDS